MNPSEYKQKLEDEALEVYQYIVDNCEHCAEEMPKLIEKLHDVDMSGQFFASSARYLAAVNRENYEPWFAPLIEGAIEKDREHKYIGSLLTSIWGEDYEQRLEELKLNDDNFRRIYKRLHPEHNIM